MAYQKKSWNQHGKAYKAYQQEQADRTAQIRRFIDSMNLDNEVNRAVNRHSSEQVRQAQEYYRTRTAESWQAESQANYGRTVGPKMARPGFSAPVPTRPQNSPTNTGREVSQPLKDTNRGPRAFQTPTSPRVAKGSGSYGGQYSNAAMKSGPTIELPKLGPASYGQRYSFDARAYMEGKTYRVAQIANGLYQLSQSPAGKIAVMAARFYAKRNQIMTFLTLLDYAARLGNAFGPNLIATYKKPPAGWDVSPAAKCDNFGDFIHRNNSCPLNGGKSILITTSPVPNSNRWGIFRNFRPPAIPVPGWAGFATFVGNGNSPATITYDQAKSQWDAQPTNGIIAPPGATSGFQYESGNQGLPKPVRDAVNASDAKNNIGYGTDRSNGSAPGGQPKPQTETKGEYKPPSSTPTRPVHGKEKKLGWAKSIPRWYMGMFNIAAEATEMVDLVDILYGALPKRIRFKVKPTGKLSPGAIWAGHYYVDFWDKSEAVYKYYNHIDWNKAIPDLIANHFSDKLIGAIAAGGGREFNKAGVWGHGTLF